MKKTMTNFFYWDIYVLIISIFRIKPVLIIGFFVLNFFDIMYLNYILQMQLSRQGFLIFITSKPFKEKTELKKISFFFTIFLYFSSSNVNQHSSIIKSTFKTYLYSKFFIIGWFFICVMCLKFNCITQYW